MSIAVIDYVWKHSKQKETKLLMLLAIADNANDQGSAFPNIDTLAAKCRTGRRNAQAIILDLQLAGELIVTPRPGTSNLYTIPLTQQQKERAQRHAEQKRAELKRQGANQDSRVNCDSHVNQDSWEGRTVIRGGDESGFVGGANQDSYEPSINRQKNRQLNKRETTNVVAQAQDIVSHIHSVEGIVEPQQPLQVAVAEAVADATEPPTPVPPTPSPVKSLSESKLMQEAVKSAMIATGKWRADSLSKSHHSQAGKVAKSLHELPLPVAPDDVLSLVEYVSASAKESGKDWNIFWLPTAVSDWRNAPGGKYVSKKKSAQPQPQYLAPYHRPIEDDNVPPENPEFDVNPILDTMLYRLSPAGRRAARLAAGVQA